MEHVREEEHGRDDSGRHPTPPATRQKRNALELESVAKVFSELAREAPHVLSASQWREFCQKLNKKLDAETKRLPWSSRFLVWYDRVTATDSLTLRVAFYAAVLGAVALIALLAWLAIELATPEPVPVQPSPVTVELVATSHSTDHT
jgi:hypothetical protein